MPLRSRMGSSALLVLLALAGLVVVSSEDSRLVVPYSELGPELSRFSAVGAEGFSEMLFDFPRYQLVVGARDALFRLGLDKLSRLEEALWPAGETDSGLCTAKGQSEEACRNHIRVLVSLRDRVFACGTHAFSPQCTWREIESLNTVIKKVDGRGKCPYDPHVNTTAYLTRDGAYYVAATFDFSSTDPAIYRMSSQSFKNALRTMQHNSHWLNQPDFVASFESDQYMYFVFREPAVEYTNCGKAIYSRIGRVCKDDQGGKIVLKNTWTTFLKARLNCSIPGEYPFYYNEIQSAFYVAEEERLYATFTTGENDVAASAVCSFSLRAIEHAFEGPFKKQAAPGTTWEPVKDVDHSLFECGSYRRQSRGLNDASSDELKVKEYQLMDRAVEPVSKKPIYTETLSRFSHINVEVLSTKHEQDRSIHVLFVATRDGAIKKLSFNTLSSRTCLVEVLHPFERAVQVNNMKFLKTTSSLYLATEKSVVRVSTDRCSRFKTQQDCLNAMDPYCGWNTQKNECTRTPSNNPKAAYWAQRPLTCPVLTDPVAGGWGQWAQWQRCNYQAESMRRLATDHCMCRRRACDSPAPRNGGTPCTGSALDVTNCTQHGGWTDWSEWSPCSNTCGIGQKTRKRFCGNPTPAFGGRVCVGPDTDTSFCDNLPECSQTGIAVANSASLVREEARLARWTQWSDWSSCSAECGKGFRSRERRCFDHTCDKSCSKQYEACEVRSCSDVIRMTDWTNWIKDGNTSVGGGWYEKRFSFTYPAVLAAKQTGYVNEEERYCSGRHKCSVTSISKKNGNSFHEWTEWSKCTRECGTGVQVRLRDCPRGDRECNGFTVAERECNTQPCPGQWSCWSEWSECNERKKKRRSRDCEVSAIFGDEYTGAVVCPDGVDIEEMNCDGWGDWTAWSPCDPEGFRERYRSCLATTCMGSDRQKLPCEEVNTTSEDLFGSSSSPSSSRVSVSGVVGFCVLSFLCGGLLGAALVYYFFLYRRGLTGANGSPHYVSAKSQNLYVSLPMLDLNKHSHTNGHSKHMNGSECGTLRSTTTAGTLRSKASSSVYGGSSKANGGLPYSSHGLNGSLVSDYETATIKRSKSQRNSSLLNGSSALRADLESDQLFT